MISGKANPSIVPPFPAPYKIALVEDQKETLRQWLQIFESFAEFRCDCTCGSAEEALQIIPEKQPNLVLMDVFLPGMSGIECTKRLKALLPKTLILMLTASDDEDLVFQALAAGADGYFLKYTKPEELRNAMLDALNSGTPMASGKSRRLVNDFRKRARARGERAHLE